MKSRSVSGCQDNPPPAQVGETEAQEGEGAGRKDCPPTPNPHLWLSLAKYSANMRTAWSSGAEDGLISSRTTPYFLYGETSMLSAPPALPWNTESFSGFQHHPNEAPMPRTYTRHPRDSSSCQVPNPHFALFLTPPSHPLLTCARYALYRKTSLSTSLSGLDGCGNRGRSGPTGPCADKVESRLWLSTSCAPGQQESSLP